MAIAEPPRRITIDLDSYLELLIEKDVFDADSWPEGMRAGAELLRRIREIEQQCVAEHGQFHCDHLAPGVEDDYLSAVSALERLIEPDDDLIPWEEFKVQLHQQSQRPQ